MNIRFRIAIGYSDSSLFIILKLRMSWKGKLYKNRNDYSLKERKKKRRRKQVPRKQ